MADLRSEIERYTEAVTNLREENRRAHELLRDLREERKRLIELRDTLMTTTIEKIDKEIAESFDKLTDHLPAMLNEIQESIYDRFDTIMMICMGDDPESVRQGKRTTIELIKEYVAKKKLPIRITEQVHLLMSRETAAHDRTLRMAERMGVAGKLPIVYDGRVPRGRSYLVIPKSGDGERASIVEIDVRTGHGAKKAIELLREYSAKQSELEDAVPEAFRRSNS